MEGKLKKHSKRPRLPLPPTIAHKVTMVTVAGHDHGWLKKEAESISKLLVGIQCSNVFLYLFL